MTSFVELPAYPVFRAAEATCKVMNAHYELNMNRIRAGFRKPYRFLWRKLQRTEAEVEAIMKDGRIKAVAWEGGHEKFLRAYGLMAITTAALQTGPHAKVCICPADLEAIRDMFFADEFQKLVQVAGMRAAKAETGS